MADLTSRQFTDLKKGMRESSTTLVEEFNKVFDSKYTEKTNTLGDVTVTDAQKQKLRKTLLGTLIKTVYPRNVNPKAGRKRTRARKEKQS